MFSLTAIGGCSYAMPMPSEDLRILPLPAGETGPAFLHEVRRLSIPGDVSYGYGPALASSDGDIIAVSLRIFHRPTPMSTATSRSAVAAWSLQSGELIRLIDDGSAEQDGSGSGLLDLSSDGTLVITWQPGGMEVRRLTTGATLLRVVDADGPAAWTARFDPSGRSVLVAQSPPAHPPLPGEPTQQPASRRIRIDLVSGERADDGVHGEIEDGACGDLAVRPSAQRRPTLQQRSTGDPLPLELPGGRGGKYFGDVTFSPDCSKLAITFRGFAYLIPPFDVTPTHVRIWDVGSGALKAWYKDEAEEVVPLAFLNGTNLLILKTTRSFRSSTAPGSWEYEDHFRLIDTASRCEVACHLRQRDSLGAVSPLAGGRFLAVATWSGISVLQVHPPGGVKDAPTATP